MADIEVEIRGRVKDDFEKTLDLFKKKAQFVKEKDRLSLVYSRRTVCQDVREIRDDPVDLRLRITNKVPELILKYGRWGAEEQRHEISIPVTLEKFEDAVDFLKYLEWDKGVITATKTFVFDYKGIEFALVKSKVYNYFEAEIVVKSKPEANKARQKILEAITSLGLSVIGEEEFMDCMNEMNNAPGMQFDFSKQKFVDFRKKFKEYF